MRTTLVIMAAGIGSRFGGGIKQLAPVGLTEGVWPSYKILPIKWKYARACGTVPGEEIGKKKIS